MLLIVPFFCRFCCFCLALVLVVVPVLMLGFALLFVLCVCSYRCRVSRCIDCSTCFCSCCFCFFFRLLVVVVFGGGVIVHVVIDIHVCCLSWFSLSFLVVVACAVVGLVHVFENVVVVL